MQVLHAPLKKDFSIFKKNFLIYSMLTSKLDQKERNRKNNISYKTSLSYYILQVISRTNYLHHCNSNITYSRRVYKRYTVILKKNVIYY